LYHVAAVAVTVSIIFPVPSAEEKERKNVAQGGEKMKKKKKT